MGTVNLVEEGSSATISQARITSVIRDHSQNHAGRKQGNDEATLDPPSAGCCKRYQRQC